MLQRLIDDFKTSSGASLRMAALAASGGFAGVIAVAFGCAAGFIAVMDRYGAIAACLALAGIFLAIAVVVAAIYASKKKLARQRAAAAARAAARAAANAPRLDPMMLATGIQIARAVGLKKLVPLLALAGVAFGYMASRNGSSADESQESDGLDDDADDQDSAEQA